MPNTPFRMPARRPERAPRQAGALRAGDFIHDQLIPMTVDRFLDSPPHVVELVGIIASGTEITVRFLHNAPLDVTRMVPTSAPPTTLAGTARRARGHLSLVK